MRKYWRIYRTFFNNAFSYEAQYRVDTLIKLAVNVLWIAMLFLTIEIFFQFTAEFNGWDKSQVYLLTSCWVFMDELYIFLFRENMYHFSTAIAQGELDLTLVKPANALFMFSCKRLLFRALYRCLIQLFIIIWVIWRFDFQFSIFSLSAAVATLFAGIIVYYSFTVIVNTFSFWFTRIDNINDALAIASSLGRYPLDIFPRFIRVAALTIVPVAFSAYIPVAVLLQKWTWPGALYAVGFAIFIFFIAVFFWRYAICRYSSASS